MEENGRFPGRVRRVFPSDLLWESAARVKSSLEVRRVDGMGETWKKGLPLRDERLFAFVTTPAPRRSRNEA